MMTSLRERSFASLGPFAFIKPQKDWGTGVVE
jgi:hypothetical protein